MTLGRQTALLLGLLLLVLTVVCAGLFRIIFAPLFRDLERDDASADGLVIASLFLEQADGLTGTARDWAVWDETWSFMQTGDSSYLRRNLDTEGFHILDIRAVALVDTAGSMVAGLENAGEEGFPMPPGPDVLSLLGSGFSAAAARGDEAVGFALVDGVPCVIAVQPILPTVGIGTHLGGLVLVRDLTPLVRRLRQESPGSTICIRQSAGSSPGSDPLVSTSGDSIRVDIGLPSITVPGLELSISRPRGTWVAFTRILRYFTLYLAASGLLFSLVTLALMHKLVVSRLSQILRRLLPGDGGTEPGTGGGGLDEVELLENAMDPLLTRLESATSELRASERKTAAMLAALPDFLIIMHESGRILMVHPGFGNDQIIPPEKTVRMALEDFDLSQITPDEIRDRIHRALETATVERFEFGLRAGGLSRVYEASMVAFGEDQVLVVMRDETQRRLMEQEAVRIQKLESLGALAGGMAHDFNNCLAAILGNVEIASAGVSDERNSAALERARKACGTARQIALRLLTFSAGGEPVRQPVSLEEVVREIVPPMLTGSAVHLELEFAKGLGMVSADPDQLAQLVRRIVANSLEAMGTAGSLRIAASSLDSDGSTHVPRGRFIQISVSDTGPGIPRENLGRVFEPYFTSKPDAPGLGLAVCFSIARKHGGRIEAVAGTEGAEIRIWLPESVEAPLADGVPPVSMGETLAGLRVLVMDDDPLVLETFTEMLRSLGVEPGGARDGAEAVQRFSEAERARKPWDVMILDLVVPGGMGGLEALSRIRRLSTSSKAVVSSGYSADAVLSEYRAHGFDSTLRKPFTLDELREALLKSLKTCG